RPVRGLEPILAPAEQRAVASRGAGARLARLLSDADGFTDRRTKRELVREWLELAAERDLLAPPRVLVGLAEMATSEVALRPLVRAVGGERLAWLASHGPGRWAWVFPDELQAGGEGGWQMGTLDVRTRHLHRIRAADPGAGRELLAETWAQERAADLAALIRVCLTGLSDDDEAWLEKALDDRRAQVREAAAELLAALPSSSWRLRMAERALACVRADGPNRLQIVPPAELDASLRRDGLTNRPPYGLGERAWLLLQIVSSAPLECWSSLDAHPEDLLARKANDDWRPTLLQGWARAALLQKDRCWALALYRCGFEHAPPSLPQLVSLLAPQDAVEVAQDAVRGRPGRMNELLAALPRPWSAEVAEIVLGYLSQPSQRQRGGWSTLTYLAETGLSPDALPRVRALAEASDDDSHRAALEQLASLLQIRHEIRQEFL
uniref:DUF5691 domain-containing protein n=1 Tax=Allorhizocola rhizosphaerae TaxID=1872709 RepID=UPI001FEB25E9